LFAVRAEKNDSRHSLARIFSANLQHPQAIRLNLTAAREILIQAA